MAMSSVYSRERCNSCNYADNMILVKFATGKEQYCRDCMWEKNSKYMSTLSKYLIADKDGYVSLYTIHISPERLMREEIYQLFCDDEVIHATKWEDGTLVVTVTFWPPPDFWN